MEYGLNGGIFGAVIPTAHQLERDGDQDARVTQLLATKGAFSASAQWTVCKSRIGNASVVLRAQKEQLQLDAAKVAATSQAKSERRAKLHELAYAALCKHQEMPERMTDKDWVATIRWVLRSQMPQGKLKIFRKRMQS